MRRAEAGFTLVEMVVSLLLLALVVAVAAQLLGETQQMLLDAGRETLDPSGALVAARLRADVLGATVAVAAQNLDLTCAYLQLGGNPPGPIVYRLDRGALTRTVVAADGTASSTVLLGGATGFYCATVSAGGPGVVLLSYSYRRSRVRRSPLPLLPGLWAPRQEVVADSLVLTPRGGGLGSSW